MLMGLLLIEGVLRIRLAIKSKQLASLVAKEQITEWDALQNPIPDPMLRVRMAPYAGEHDAKGWRNASVPKKADIVAIGDSQTWGINVGREHAWPQTLGTLSTRTVYNMGLGYYGPVEYWILIDEALELSPEVIVIGLYLGNDLYGAYYSIYKTDAFPQFRNPNLEERLIEDKVAANVQLILQERDNFQKPKSWWDNFITQTLPTYSALIKAFQWRGYWPATSLSQDDRDWATAYPQWTTVYDERDATRTVFSTGYRFPALDLNNPQILEGLRITKKMLKQIQIQTDEADVELIILLIPTKELVYLDVMQAAYGQNLDETYINLVSMEEKTRSEIMGFCQSQNIDCIDSLPALRQAIFNNKQIYPTGLDDHPVANGYFVLASTVKDALERYKVAN